MSCLELHFVEVVVDAFAREEFGVRAHFNNLSFDHGDDDVGFLDGGKAMGDADGGATDHEFFEGLLDGAFAVGVE